MESIFVFLAGSALLIYSAEKLVGYLVGIASRLHISLFLLAIIFTGIEFDDVFLGVTLNVEDLGGVAVGLVFGTAMSLPGVVLALAALLVPTKVNIPRDYLVLFACSPLVMAAFTLFMPLNALSGVLLIVLFSAFLGYVVVRESRSETPVFRDAELYEAYVAARESHTTTLAPDPDREQPDFAARMPFSEARLSGWVGLGLAVLALAGLVVGASVTGAGTAGILHHFGLQDTLFGATITTLVLTVEDIFLTVEPARRGAPEIGVGNVIGSVIFSVTGKLGIILLAGSLVVDPSVYTLHLPALILITAVATYFLSTGRLRRWHGVVLLALYIVYWALSYGVFDFVPADIS